MANTPPVRSKSMTGSSIDGDTLFDSTSFRTPRHLELFSVGVLDMERNLREILCVLDLVRDVASDRSEQMTLEIDAQRIPPQRPGERLGERGVQPIVLRLLNAQQRVRDERQTGELGGARGDEI